MIHVVTVVKFDHEFLKGFDSDDLRHLQIQHNATHYGERKYQIPLFRQATNSKHTVTIVPNTTALISSVHSTPPYVISTQASPISDLAQALGRVEDPVFVVYGNRGYQAILGNFMALFSGHYDNY